MAKRKPAARKPAPRRKRAAPRGGTTQVVGYGTYAQGAQASANVPRSRGQLAGSSAIAASPTEMNLGSLSGQQNSTDDLIDQLFNKLAMVLTHEPTATAIPSGGEVPGAATPLLLELDARYYKQRSINSRLEYLLERITL